MRYKFFSLSILFIWFILIYSFRLFGTEQHNSILQKFTEGNKFYEAGDYNKAIEIYETLIKEFNIQSSVIYYNLGNAYYRINQIGKAILNYERAIKLNPRDEDIHYNLKYVKSLIKDIEPENIFQKLYRLLKVNELKVLLTISNTILFVFLGIYITKKDTISRKLSILFGFIFVIFLFWTILRISDENKKFGIVISTTVIRSGPGEDYTPIVTTPEGKKLEILSEQESWYGVAVSFETSSEIENTAQLGQYQKYKGWIEKTKLEKI